MKRSEHPKGWPPVAPPVPVEPPVGRPPRSTRRRPAVPVEPPVAPPVPVEPPVGGPPSSLRERRPPSRPRRSRTDCRCPRLRWDCRCRRRPLDRRRRWSRRSVPSRLSPAKPRRPAARQGPDRSLLRRSTPEQPSDQPAPPTSSCLRRPAETHSAQTSRTKATGAPGAVLGTSAPATPSGNASWATVVPAERHKARRSRRWTSEATHRYSPRSTQR